MDIRIEEDALVVIVQDMMYSEDVVFKCFYWYAAGYSINIDRPEKSLIRIVIQPKDSQEDMQALTEKVRKDLIDFKLRDIVTKETRTIRELIVAKAFAYADVIADPSSVVSDPVGFDPLLIN